MGSEVTTHQPSLLLVEGYGVKFKQIICVLCVLIVISLLHFQSSDYWFLINTVHVDIPPVQPLSPTQVVTQVTQAFEDLNVQPTAPHIVLMVADDLGWNDISWHNPLVRSPNLENLARSGILLEQHYAQHICTPSRGALLTGRYPIHIGLNDHGGALRPETPHGMLPGVPTLADILQEEGYSTYAVGKWHLGFCNQEYLPTSRGFDHHYGLWNGAEDHYSHRVHRGYDFRDDQRVSVRDEGIYSTELFQKRALRIIRKHNKTRPLFLYLPFQSVHAPLQVPQVYKDMYTNTTNDNNRATLLGMVTSMDDAVGNITAVLKTRGMFENTLIVFLSDNGAPVANSGSNWPLRGSKHTLFEGGTKVPAFVSGLGLQPRVESRLFHISDWLPTILSAVDHKNAVANVDGVSHWKALVNKNSSWSRSEILYNIDNFSSDHDTPISAIRVGDWKYIWREKGSWQGWYLPSELNLTSKETETWEGYRWQQQDIHSKNGNRDHIWNAWFLYPEKNKTRKKKKIVQNLLFNLATDPLERVNLAESNPEKVAKLEERIREHNRTMYIINGTLPNITGTPINRIWGTGWC